MEMSLKDAISSVVSILHFVPELEKNSQYSFIHYRIKDLGEAVEKMGGLEQCPVLPVVSLSESPIEEGVLERQENAGWEFEKWCQAKINNSVFNRDECDKGVARWYLFEGRKEAYIQVMKKLKLGR